MKLNLVLIIIISMVFLLPQIKADNYQDCTVYGNCKPVTPTTSSIVTPTNFSILNVTGMTLISSVNCTTLRATNNVNCSTISQQGDLVMTTAVGFINGTSAGIVTVRYFINNSLIDLKQHERAAVTNPTPYAFKYNFFNTGTNVNVNVTNSAGIDNYVIITLDVFRNSTVNVSVITQGGSGTVNNNTLSVNNSQYLGGLNSSDFWIRNQNQINVNGNKSGAFNFFDSSQRRLYDNGNGKFYYPSGSNNVAYDVQGGFLYSNPFYTTGNPSIDLNFRNLYRNDGVNSINYNIGITYGQEGGYSEDYLNRLLIASGNLNSLDWQNRLLYSSNQIENFDWSNDSGNYIPTSLGVNTKNHLNDTQVFINGRDSINECSGNINQCSDLSANACSFFNGCFTDSFCVGTITQCSQITNQDYCNSVGGCSWDSGSNTCLDSPSLSGSVDCSSFTSSGNGNPFGVGCSSLASGQCSSGTLFCTGSLIDPNCNQIPTSSGYCDFANTNNFCSVNISTNDVRQLVAKAGTGQTEDIFQCRNSLDSAEFRLDKDCDLITVRNVDISGKSTFSNDVTIGGNFVFSGSFTAQFFGNGVFIAAPFTTGTFGVVPTTNNSGSIGSTSSYYHAGFIIDIFAKNITTNKLFADIIHTTNLNVTNLNVSKNLLVLGNATINGNLTVGGNTTIGGNLNISQNLIVTGNFSAKRPYLVATDNTTQAFLNTANTQVVNISTIEDNYLIDIQGKQNITFQQSGDYQITFQPLFSSNAANKHVEFWIQITNNSGVFVDVPRSNTRIELASANTEAAQSITYQVDANSTRKVRIMWWSDNTGSSLLDIAPASSPNRPEVPSVILNVQKVSEITS